LNFKIKLSFFEFKISNPSIISFAPTNQNINEFRILNRIKIQFVFSFSLLAYGELLGDTE
jgi:hypothetical protein